MREIGIWKLRSRLNKYIQLVKGGEVVRVTHHGQVVAEMRAPEPRGPEPSSELERKYPLLAEMARKGLVRLPLEPNRPGIYRLLPSVTPPGTAAKLLDEIRGDR